MTWFVRFSVFKRSRILLAAFSVVHVESLLCVLLGLAFVLGASETMRNDDVIFTRIRLVIRWRLVVITCGLLLYVIFQMSTYLFHFFHICPFVVLLLHERNES